MTRRGRERRLVLEDEYWKLILGGVPTVEACRQIGIGRKTGYRWRTEAGGLPPARAAEATRSSRYLSLLERQRIATLRERGHGVREIARRIGRAPSTVSRELRRHLQPHDKGVYDADLAHARARDNARRERAGVLVGDHELRDLVAANSKTPGVRSRSVPGCAASTPSGRTGTCVTKRSIRLSISGGKEV
jgi:transposase-like protein